jgi:RNA 2',3'-cyclic 3'-phosphodiesterase
MPRLFSAVKLPVEIEDTLSSLETDIPGARWMSSDDYHITVRFFGDMDGREADDLVAGLSAQLLPMFRITVGGLACFGGDRPRALIAEVDGGAPLRHLNRAHEQAARKAGLEPERRKFTPHVTVARLDGTRAETIARFIQSAKLPPFEPFLAESVELFSSRPGIGGSPYVLEHSFQLRPPT